MLLLLVVAVVPAVMMQLSVRSSVVSATEYPLYPTSLPASMCAVTSAGWATSRSRSSTRSAALISALLYSNHVHSSMCMLCSHPVISHTVPGVPGCSAARAAAQAVALLYLQSSPATIAGLEGALLAHVLSDLLVRVP